MGVLAILSVLSCTRQVPEQPVPGTPAITVTAGFECDETPVPQTKTSLSLNEEETSAQVLWTAGDRFLMLRNSAQAVFTTEETGKRVTFTTDTNLPGEGTCISVYPADKYLSSAITALQRSYGMVLPSVQTAVPGGIENGLNLAVACSTGPEADLVFRNILSYIRFRLDGEATREVRSVIFDAGTNIAGDLTITGIQNNAPKVSLKRDWSGSTEEKSPRIRLEGPFTPGQDYFIAVAPLSLDGFEMLFKNEDGRAIRKRSTLSLDLVRSTVYDFGTIALGDDFSSAANYYEETVTYQQATAGYNPVVLCVIPEAFREPEMPLYDSLARAALDFLFQTEPYHSYQDYFTAHILRVPSEESGAAVSNGSSATNSHDTPFKAYWGNISYSNMDADADRIWDFVSRNCPEIQRGTHALTDVMILMIINDERYAAISHCYSDGRCYAMVPYSHYGGAIQWYYPALVPNGDDGPDDGYHNRTEADYAEFGLCTGDWRYTAVHEFGGHAIGRLYDEYWGNTYGRTPEALACQSWSVPFGLNITHMKDAPPWRESLLDPQDELIARDPNYGRVGVFQGAGGKIYNKWRSEKISCMVDCRPYFSAWQRILIVRRIKELAGTSFSWDEFWAKDKTADPLRDLLTDDLRAQPKAAKPVPVIVPPPPHPVLHDAKQPVMLQQR